jgi:metal-responsive CopG/Arc/MetJ family transcriptional regulator
MSKIRDRRFTVSVAADVADRLDQYVSSTKNVNRSEIVEQALRLWETLAEYSDKSTVLQEAVALFKKQQERELYRSYYAELSAAAKEEDRAWSELGQESAGKGWPSPHSPSSGT